MLGKLLKYDLKYIFRLLLPISMLAGVIGILGACAFRLTASEAIQKSAPVITLICGLFIGISFMALFAYLVVALILSVSRFYTNLYTDEGYLTFTLPAKTSVILTSKLLASLISQLIAILVLMISLFIFLFFGLAEDLSDFSVIVDAFQTITIALTQLDGANVAVNMILIILSAFSNLLQSTCSIFLAITIGAVISKKHKILVSIAVYYAINTVVSVISSVVGLLTSSVGLTGVTSDPNTIGEALTSTLGVALVVSLCISAICFFICNYMMKHKLNLP